MKNKYGKVFRELRKSKSYSLEYVSEGVSSVSLLSKFERGEVDISFTKLLSLLNKIHISLYEFELAANNYKSIPIETLMSQLKLNYESNNIGAIKLLMSKEISKYENNTKLIHHKLNSIMINSILDDLNNTQTLSDNDKSILMDYLFSLDNWTYYEIILYSNSLNSLNISSIKLLSKELLQKTMLLSNNLRYRKLLLETLINTCILLLEQKLFTDFLFFYNATINFNLLESELYERTILYYLDGYYTYCCDKNNLGLLQMEKAISTFSMLNCTNLEINFTTHLKQINL